MTAGIIKAQGNPGFTLINSSHNFIFLLLVAFIFSTNAGAQIFGGNPGSIKWQQVNTDTARIIFPAGLQDAARRVASVVHELNKNHTASIGNRPGKINIVLQNQTTLPNAYVGLGPYRSEFYLTPPQNSFELGGQSWIDNLSLHEYRHVQQFNNFNTGIAKPFKWLFGQEGQALASSLIVPDYFFEGDAVFNETALSQQGRGRIPDFFNGYQSLFREQRKYNFMKLRNGSFRHFVPDHYELGYLLVGYGREKYGADFWRKVSQDAMHLKPLIYPWQGAIKKRSGVSYKQFVSEARAFYSTQWQKVNVQPLKYITSPAANARTDYKYVYKDANDDLIVLKRGYKNIPAFYKISGDGSEQKIAIRDIAHEDYFSYSNGKIAYATLKPDVRWGYREFSDIVLMDAATGNRTTITKGEKYFSPDISHDGTKIVAVDMRPNQNSVLTILDLEGNKIFRSAAKRGVVYTYPKFAASDQQVYTLVRNGEGQMALSMIDIGSGKEEQLIPFSNRLYGFPTIQGDTIFFSSSYKGSDEVWAYVVNQKETFRVAVHPTGLYQAVYDAKNKRLYTSNFTAQGYRLAAIPADDLLWQPISNKENALPDLYIPKALQQENNKTTANIEIRDFPVVPYRKGFNLFNFHSWRPLYDLQEFSLAVYGQNILNTFQSEFMYTYNRNEGSHRAGYSAVYGGWYVQPFAGINNTWNRTIALNRDTSVNYNELNVNAGLQLPLNLSGGRQYRFLNLRTSINNQNVQWTGIGKSLLKSRSFNYLQGQVQYSGQIQKALQQIYPRWAQTILLRYRTAINNVTAQQFLANATIYLPGLHTNHNLVVSGAFQKRDTMNQYYFSNSFPFSRGYSSVDFGQMWRLGLNYHLPLFYPDFGIGNIIYLQRIRANGFYDMTEAKSLRTGLTIPFSSVGGEIFFDTKWWNQQPVTIGLRYSRLLNQEFRRVTNPNMWEVILPINLLD